MHTSSHYSLTLTHCETKILSAIKVILHSQDPEGESEYFPMANSHITSVCLHDCDHVHHHGYDHGHHHDYDHVLHGHGHHRDYDRDHRLLGLASDTDCSPLNKKRIELNTTTKSGIGKPGGCRRRFWPMDCGLKPIGTAATGALDVAVEGCAQELAWLALKSLVLATNQENSKTHL